MLTRYLLLFLVAICVSFSHAKAEDAEQNTEIAKDERLKRSRNINRILEGVVSNEHDFRYQVAVMRIIKEMPVLICGGAIIHRRYVLTAAHCVDKYRSTELVVRHGGVKGPHPTKPQLEQRSFYTVVKTMIPKQYSSKPCRKHLHDIAILKVKQSFDLSYPERFRKAILPEYNSDFEDVEAIVSGYGPDYAQESSPLESKGPQDKFLKYVDQLRSMPAAVIANEECQRNADVVITESTLCVRALNPNSQTCFDDDGGPLVYDGIIIGIGNDRQCNPEVPEIFTRVTSYLPFIYNVLKHRSSPDVLIR